MTINLLRHEKLLLEMVCRSHSWHSRAEGIQRDVHASFADQWRPTKVLFVLAILSLECRIAALFMMLA